MDIAGYIKTSLIEWPGKIASVVFTQGCNFHCPFCHNADLVEIRRYENMKIRRYEEKEILEDLKKRKGWVEAVVVTGGEPTLQTDLRGFLSGLKRMGLLTMVHTNGTNPKVISKLVISKLVDYFCMDLKGNLEDYEKFVGGIGDIGKIRESIKLITGSGVEYEFRTTVVPRLHDIKNLICLAEQIKFLVQNSKFKVQSCRWFLQQFRPMNCLDKKYLKVKPYSKEEMESFCRALQEIIPQTSLRGV